MVKNNVWTSGKSVLRALDRFKTSLDYVLVVEHDLNPAKPHFRPLEWNILLQHTTVYSSTFYARFW